MIKRSLAICFAAAAMLAAPAASAQSRDDRQSAREEMAAGNILPPREVERRLIPAFRREGYDYLTFEYDPQAQAYRLKFIRDGRVIFVDVDARTGRVLRRHE